MDIVTTEFDGLYLLKGALFNDERGVFLKTFNTELKNKLMPNPIETYFSKSKKGAVRGLHFQTGEFVQAKLVFCIRGSFIDIATDLRKESKTFGKTFTQVIDSRKGEGIFLPEGFAHGIYSLEDETEMIAQSNAPYAPGFEGGILWSSVGVNFPVGEIVSEKDSKMPTLDEYISKLTKV